MKILKILVILCSIAFFSFADDDYHKYESKNLKYLELENWQIEKIKKILIKYKYKYEKYYEYEKEQEKTLEEIMSEEYFDKEKYFNILLRIEKKEVEIEVEKISEIHKVLNKTQRKKFAKYIEDWEDD